MPLTDSILTPELTQPQPVLAEGFDPRHDAFFSVFLPAMERHGVRYRALHAGDGLLYGTEFAVDPSDEGKLSAVFSDLKDAGFLAVQSLQIESRAQRIIFARIADGQPETFVIDLFLRDLSSNNALGSANLRQSAPVGATLVFLGPDGVGKTTLLRAVSKSLEAVFPEQNIYRWRPASAATCPPAALEACAQCVGFDLVFVL
jgi:hypothetical protein